MYFQLNSYIQVYIDSLCVTFRTRFSRIVGHRLQPRQHFHELLFGGGAITAQRFEHFLLKVLQKLLVVLRQQLDGHDVAEDGRHKLAAGVQHGTGENREEDGDGEVEGEGGVRAGRQLLAEGLPVREHKVLVLLLVRFLDKDVHGGVAILLEGFEELGHPAAVSGRGHGGGEGLVDLQKRLCRGLGQVRDDLHPLVGVEVFGAAGAVLVPHVDKDRVDEVRAEGLGEVPLEVAPVRAGVEGREALLKVPDGRDGGG